MGNVHGSPEDIVNFSNALESYLNTISEETDRLSSAYQTLGETWEDPQSKAFDETFRQLLGALSSFKESASQQIPHLRIMADDLSRYLGR